ncbi:MAG TPA: GTPase Era [Candidatus Binataceae bacterium]|nr:GTPase Era [Candidatus Binataceae bacterium]
MANSGGDEYRSGYVVLCGRSNVGKSTLLNRLIGEKVAIVTPRPQTTRRRILGIRTDPDAQLILVDTPGLHDSRRLLNRRMVDVARASMTQGDVLAVVVEAGERLAAEDRAVLAEVRRLARLTVVIINKIDLLPRPVLIPLAEECLRLMPEGEIVPVSALSGENVAELLTTLKRMLPTGSALMPEDQYTDQTQRALVEEIIREKIFMAMKQEIPFLTAVKVEQFSELNERNLLRIHATIIVERDSHKGMVIGAGGQQLKQIGQSARVEIEQQLDRRVYLELHVKVEKNWTSDPRRLSELGL